LSGLEPPPLPVRAAKPGDGDAPLITTARDRLAIAPPPAPRRGGWFWPAFGAAVVGFLAAIVWVYQIPIRDVVVERLTAVGIDVIAGGEVARVDVSAAPETIPDAGGAAGAEAIPDADRAARAEAIPESTVAEETEIAPEQEIAAPPVTPDPEAQPVTPDPRIDVESRAAAEADLPRDSSAAEPPEPSRFAFAEGPFRAQEGGSAAAITVNREGGIGSRATIVWWTTGDTARAGEDYADLGQQTEVFEPGVESLTFHVPLVDDGLSEPPEGFLVSIGQPNPGSGRVDPSATTGVIIQDDDNSPR